jgi:hypothetical protein
LGMMTTMTTTTGPTGGRGNANDFTGYIYEDNNDNPIGGRRGNAGGERRKRRRRRMMTRGWQAVTMTVGRARTARGGRSTTPFLGLQ